MIDADRDQGAVNRDPLRHVTLTEILGYAPTCECGAPAALPIVLDPFGGTMSVGQVAINMGCKFIGLDGSPEYVPLGIKRIETPWAPKDERKQAVRRIKRKIGIAVIQRLLRFE